MFHIGKNIFCSLPFPNISYVSKDIVINKFKDVADGRLHGTRIITTESAEEYVEAFCRIKDGSIRLLYDWYIRNIAWFKIMTTSFGNYQTVKPIPEIKILSQIEFNKIYEEVHKNKIIFTGLEGSKSFEYYLGKLLYYYRNELEIPDNLMEKLYSRVKLILACMLEEAITAVSKDKAYSNEEILKIEDEFPNTETFESMYKSMSLSHRPSHDEVYIKYIDEIYEVKHAIENKDYNTAVKVAISSGIFLDSTTNTWSNLIMNNYLINLSKEDLEEFKGY